VGAHGRVDIDINGEGVSILFDFAGI